MGRLLCCEKDLVKKGAWTPEEDQILVDYISKHGHGTWRSLPKLAGNFAHFCFLIIGISISNCLTI